MSGNFWKICLENLEKSGENISANFGQAGNCPLHYSFPGAARFSILKTFNLFYYCYVFEYMLTIVKGHLVVVNFYVLIAYYSKVCW